MSIDAANPRINATVAASAGTGKTWMLVTRVIRLLLDDASPGAILALTFTRKAAGEMQQRLAERLYTFASADTVELDELIKQIGLSPNADTRARCRALYEQHQYADFPVRFQTFHAFCQDLLARFPLEADVPPGFELLDNTQLALQQAREALYNQATLDMDSALAQQLQALQRLCGSQHTTEQLLHQFIQHRSDWWAFTEQQPDPVGFARQQLQQKMGVDETAEPVQDFFCPHNLEQLRNFSQLLARHSNKTNLSFCDKLNAILEKTAWDDSDFETVREVFLTRKNEARKREDKPALRKAVGDHTDTLLQIHNEFVEKVLALLDQLNRLTTLQINALWYACGHACLHQFQTLKTALRQLDFTDLEWRSYQLLRESDHALWVQYKLDHRIDHILVDEFQDTNPTQWQLILPLLEELAAGQTERARSVFLVGDEKQSIYSFRRAKPELQSQASEWLQQQLQAQAFPLNKSRRSSPAVIRFVNQVFNIEAVNQQIQHFTEHDTYLEQLPGRIVNLGLAEMEEAPAATNTEFRNPLLQPRDEPPRAHQQEAERIAETIQQLIQQGYAIGQGTEQRAVQYDDIMILMRKRTHMPYIEQALRNAGIPYLGSNRGTLLECIEIEDMLALLSSILTPFDNLALAQVLKSPLFQLNDDDLKQIAQFGEGKHWFEKLGLLQSRLPETHGLCTAWQSLNEWRHLCDRIPVHDLLDRIYHQRDLVNQYQQQVPASLRPRVKANLQRFLEMSLELRGGRYPSLTQFVDYIRTLKALPDDNPDEAPASTDSRRVRIMTIHASKGLEAPIVFLADCLNTNRDHSSFTTLVHWPASEAVPQHVQLLPRSKQRDTFSASYIELQKAIEQREDANLLYVALTRSRQMLYFSGSKNQRQNREGWFVWLEQALQTLSDNDVYSFGEIPTGLSQQEAETATTSMLPPPAIPEPQPSRMISPSEQVESMMDETDLSTDTHGALRGTAVHRALELLTQSASVTPPQLIRRICYELDLPPDAPLVVTAVTEASQLISNPRLQALFQLPQQVRAINECPISYDNSGQLVKGVIDRLVLFPDRAWIIDYKSHSTTQPDALQQLAETYRQQLTLYKTGISRAWPEHNVDSYILFTHTGQLYHFESHGWADTLSH